jgi:hypothetical protein
MCSLYKLLFECESYARIHEILITLCVDDDLMGVGVDAGFTLVTVPTPTPTQNNQHAFVSSC